MTEPLRILLVSRELPDPNGVGVQRRAAQHLRALAGLGPVTVILPQWIGAGRRDLSFLRAVGASEVMIRTEDSLPRLRRARHYDSPPGLSRQWHALRRPAYFDDRAPRAAARGYRERLRSRFDVLFAFRLSSAVWADSVFGYGPDRPPVSIVDFDDLESVAFDANIIEDARQASLARRLMLLRDRWLLRAKERELMARWSATSLCSARDADRISAAGRRRPWLIPNALVIGEPPPPSNGEVSELLFVGSFGYAPNVEGVRWFVDQVWPSVRAALGPRCRLTLAGYGPPPSVQALANPEAGVRVVADAPDLAPLYAQAMIVIVPLRSGSGTRIKAIEAAANKRAIVTTSLGCEGLGFVAGVHVEMTDEPLQFAGAILRLADDPTRRQALTEHAYDHARALFSADNVSEELRTRIIELSAKLRGPRNEATSSPEGIG